MLSWEKMCSPKEKGGLGFRDLKAFNLALLAKQGWRLQNNHGSLVHRVFQARYFLCTDFLHAELDSKPAYAWRSIMATQTVVKSRCKWRISDGATVGIWMGRWLPTPTNFQIISTPRLLPSDSKVSSLMHPTTEEWNTFLLKQIFLPGDVHTILSIPLGSFKPRDHLIWAYTPRGLFIVNNAYKLALSMN